MFNDDDDEIDDVAVEMARLEAAALTLVARIGPDLLRAFAEKVRRSGYRQWMLEVVPAEHREAAERVLDPIWNLDDFSAESACAYLCGIAAGFERHQACCRDEHV